VNTVLNPLSVASLLVLTAMAWAAVPSMALPLAAVFGATLLGAVLAYWAEKAGKVTVYLTPTDPPYIIFMNLSYRYLLLPAMAAGVIFYTPPQYPLVLLLAAALAYQVYLYSKLARARA
ncbi:MAG: hypothetical protein JRM80_13225, partial [Nitrososphaerota archaeon]|nr:hypothetical protein [Nitrososphaerota archaeon]